MISNIIVRSERDYRSFTKVKIAITFDVDLDKLDIAENDILYNREVADDERKQYKTIKYLEKITKNTSS